MMANPGLSTIIKSIVILDFPRHYGFWRFRRFFHPPTLLSDTNLNTIMNTCTNLHSINLSSHTSETFDAQQPFRIIFDLPNLTGLKRLCLSGLHLATAHSLLVPYSSLPCLEELYVEYTLAWSEPYPSLPSLHTLSLSGCGAIHQGSLLPSHLTGIQHLELVDTSTYHYGLNHLDSLNQLTRTLTSLIILRRCNVNTPTTLDPSKFEKMQHLTLDLMAFIPNSYTTSFLEPTLLFDQLPPKLVTLTILMPFLEDFDAVNSEEAKDLQKSILQALRHALRLGIPPIPSLKSIYIEGSTSIWGSTAEELTTLLGSKGIKATFALANDTMDDLHRLVSLRFSHLRSEDYHGSLISLGQPWQPVPTRSLGSNPLIDTVPS
ncbi:hypothetical protein JAAARDRAFT_634829 [Jaapia argillacea MUCL 33604]|uniref:F-box domain-containing protein n=1 Tax=Jaapia argillacea MUCL 33604 TaxID=933084 RepID=A0A067Q8P5_9AGAM|nr:hypothetical protein JAAARDRAFT_634829 [Jaapia argillacea MUCL 33604]